MTTPAKRRAVIVNALSSLPGGGALAGNPNPFAAATDNDLVRAGLARLAATGFELTPQGQAFLARAARQ